MAFNLPSARAERIFVTEQDEFGNRVELLEDGTAKVIFEDGRTAFMDAKDVNKMADLYSQIVEGETDLLRVSSMADLLIGDDPELSGMRQSLFGDREVSLRAAHALGLRQYEKAAPFLEEASERGDLVSKYQLALLYYQGRGVPQNYEMAYKLSKEAAEAGYNHAAFLQAQCYYLGKGCQRNIAESFKWAQISHDGGSEKGTIFLANFYYSGDGVGKDYKKAFDLYQSVEHTGDDSIPYLLGRCYVHGHGCELNYARAFELFKKAEALNDSSAHYDLGLLYYHGRGVEENHQEALKYFETEYKANGPRATDARIMMGRCYYSGSGVVKNTEMAYEIAQELVRKKDGRGYYGLAAFAQNEGRHEEAFKCLQLAADWKFLRAHIGLGVSYLFGEGTAVDYKKAFKHLSLVQDDPNAFQCLGLCYLDGLGTRKNTALGIDYLKKSSDFCNDSLSNIKLGNLYFLGVDVPKDYQLAEKYFMRALQKRSGLKNVILHFIYSCLVEMNLARFFKEDYDQAALNKAMKYGKKLAGLNANDSYGDMSVRMQVENKEAIKYLAKKYQQRRIENLSTLSHTDFATLLKIDLFSVKHNFDFYFKAQEGNQAHPDFRNLQEVYHFLYDDLDQSWELLSKDQLRVMMKLIFKIINIIDSTAHTYISKTCITDLTVAPEATPEEVADSFMPVMPKKKPKAAAKPKGAQNKAAPKKGATPPQQIKSVPKTVPQPAVNQNREKVIVPEVKSVSPPKGSPVKGRASPPVVVNAEMSPVHKMLSIAQALKAAQEAIVAHYSKGVSSSLRKSIEAVFDKKSLSQDKVITLMEHLAKSENGSCVKNGNGGARLIVDDLSVGCHAFHGPGDKNHLGFIAELRKLMIALYQGKLG